MSKPHMKYHPSKRPLTASKNLLKKSSKTSNVFELDWQKNLVGWAIFGNGFFSLESASKRMRASASSFKSLSSYHFYLWLESAEFTEIHAFKIISVLISLGRKKKNCSPQKFYTEQGELAMDMGLYRPELYTWERSSPLFGLEVPATCFFSAFLWENCWRCITIITCVLSGAC